MSGDAFALAFLNPCGCPRLCLGRVSVPKMLFAVQTGPHSSARKLDPSVGNLTSVPSNSLFERAIVLASVQNVGLAHSREEILLTRL